MADGAVGGTAGTEIDGKAARPSRSRQHRLAAVVIVIVAAVVLLAATDPFSGGSGPAGGSSDTAYPIATQTIRRESISQQTQVSATVGYASAMTIQLPFGNTRAMAIDTPQTSRSQSMLASQLAHATFYGPYSMFTTLPSPGTIVRRGQELFSIDGSPVLLMYGRSVAMRAFVAGMSPGVDVAELNANLDALGYAHGLAADAFTSATAAGIRRLQIEHHEPATGQLLLGAVVFERGALRVLAVLPPVAVGSHATAGRVLAVSSTSPQVSMRLDPALEGQVKVGDPVTITLPDNRTTPGRITYVSPVASPGQSGAAIEVDAVPTNPWATHGLDQAPVSVAITTATASNVLVVPVNALLARPGGGYAVEEISAGRHHHLVAGTTGLFDDADGLVQVSGQGLAAGQRVVVPGT